MSKKKCPFCAEEILVEARKCKHCGEFLDGGHRKGVDAAPRSAPNPGTAAVLSLVIPGAGQMYRGQVGEGLAWLFFTFLGYLAMIVPGVILHLLCVFQAGASKRPSSPRSGVAGRAERLPSTLSKDLDARTTLAVLAQVTIVVSAVVAKSPLSWPFFGALSLACLPRVRELSRLLGKSEQWLRVALFLIGLAGALLVIGR